MMENTWRIGRIAGVDIKIDISWLVIAALIAWSFWARFDFLYEDQWSGGALAALAVGAAAVFFGSLLVHELAHSIVAKARGIEVKGITLFLFGGATEAELDTNEPRDELIIAGVGPLTSLAIAAALWAATFTTPTDEPLGGAIGYLAWLNLALAVFNMVPGFPLDGGRVLRAILWARTRDLAKATRWAANGGQIFGYALIALGILAVLAGDLGGLWFAVIGWFLTQAARASYQQLRTRQLLEGVRARDVMARDLITIPPDATIEDAIQQWFLRYDHGAFPVEDAGGGTLGVLSIRAVRRVPLDDRPARRVRDAMMPLSEVAHVTPETAVEDVLEQLRDDAEVARVLVTSDGQVVGMITPHDIARALRRREELSSPA